MSRSIARSARRPLAVLSVSLAAALAAPTAAQAQADCTDAPLAQYLAAGFACAVAGWSFGAFEFDAQFDHTGEAGIAGTVPAAADVMLRPFAETDAAGRLRFGFAFDGLASTTTIDGVAAAEPIAQALLLLRFTGRRVAPGPDVVHVAADASTTIDTPTPDAIALFATASATAADADRFFLCMLDEVDGGAAGTMAGACPDPVRAVEAILGHHLLFARRAGTVPLVGAASTTIARVTFTTAPQVVPEPAPLATTAAGVLALLLAARRRATAAPPSEATAPAARA